jgi:cytidine deaminase
MAKSLYIISNQVIAVIIMVTRSGLTLDQRRLLSAAQDAMKFSYSPYTQLKTGAAVLTGSGVIIPGATYEEVSYHPIDAVQSAIATANAYGHRKFEKVAISTQSLREDPGTIPLNRESYGKPSSGTARQVLAEAEELSGNAIEVIHSTGKDFVTVDSDVWSLLPHHRRPADLNIDIAKYRRKGGGAPTQDHEVDPKTPIERLKDVLLDYATLGMENAYSPYSKFKVGTAVMSPEGIVRIGANFETCFGDSIHGEQTGIGAMNSMGSRRQSAVGIIARGETFPATDATPSCGNCGQLLIEAEQISGNPIRIVLSTTDRSTIKIYESAVAMKRDSGAAFSPASLGFDVEKLRNY